MAIKVDMKWKFTVNGNEYGSREEMPENIRPLYDKALADSSRGESISSAVPHAKIVFNGEEYESVDSMPAHVRQLYEEILVPAQGREADDSGRSGRRARLAETIVTHHGHTDWAKSGKAIEPTTPVKRWLIIGFFVLLGMAILYFLLRPG
jgi:hypothetical protein